MSEKRDAQYDRWRDPEFRERLARGNGYFDAWKGYAPTPDPFYEDAYMDGYEDFEEGWWAPSTVGISGSASCSPERRSE